LPDLAHRTARFTEPCSLQEREKYTWILPYYERGARYDMVRYDMVATCTDLRYTSGSDNLDRLGIFDRIE
jgi:hypothetical protein